MKNSTKLKIINWVKKILKYKESYKETLKTITKHSILIESEDKVCVHQLTCDCVEQIKDGVRKNIISHIISDDVIAFEVIDNYDNTFTIKGQIIIYKKIDK